MSCILYSRVSFLALAGDSLFQELCKRASVDLHGIGAALFEINGAAYRVCYGIDTIKAEAESASRVDPEFMMYFKEPRNMQSLRYLLLRIDYQYAEYGIEKLDAYRQRFALLLKEVEQAVRESIHAELG